MPADTTLSQTSDKHSDGNAPYPCSMREHPPGGSGFIDYGYCRTSMDHFGKDDPRCHETCKHKADQDTARGFVLRFVTHGAKAAAEWARGRKNYGMAKN